MKKILFSLVVVLFLTGLAVAPDFRSLGGEWIRQEDGSFWYLHSEEEFLGDCQACHSEMSETFFFCLPDDKDCRIVIQDGQLHIECEQEQPEA